MQYIAVMAIPHSGSFRSADPAHNTKEEADYVLRELRRRNVHSFLLVTSDYHSGRARRIYLATERAMGYAPQFRTIASRDEFFHAGPAAQPREPENRFHRVVEDHRHRARPMTRWRSFAGVRAHLWRYRWQWAIGMSCLALKDLAQAAQPLMIRGAIDSLGVRAGAGLFLHYAGYLLGLAVVKGIFQYWMRVILIGISRDVEYVMRNELFQHLITLSPDYYARTRTGDIMARATNDLNAVRMMLGPGVMYWCETSLTFALSIIIMVRTDYGRPRSPYCPRRG